MCGHSAFWVLMLCCSLWNLNNHILTWSVCSEHWVWPKQRCRMWHLSATKLIVFPCEWPVCQDGNVFLTSWRDEWSRTNQQNGTPSFLKDKKDDAETRTTKLAEAPLQDIFSGWANFCGNTWKVGRESLSFVFDRGRPIIALSWPPLFALLLHLGPLGFGMTWFLIKMMIQVCTAWNCRSRCIELESSLDGAPILPL